MQSSTYWSALTAFHALFTLSTLGNTAFFALVCRRVPVIPGVSKPFFAVMVLLLQLAFALTRAIQSGAQIHSPSTAPSTTYQSSYFALENLSSPGPFSSTTIYTLGVWFYQFANLSLLGTICDVAISAHAAVIPRAATHAKALRYTVLAACIAVGILVGLATGSQHSSVYGLRILLAPAMAAYLALSIIAIIPLLRALSSSSSSSPSNTHHLLPTHNTSSLKRRTAVLTTLLLTHGSLETAFQFQIALAHPSPATQLVLTFFQLLVFSLLTTETIALMRIPPLQGNGAGGAQLDEVTVMPAAPRDARDEEEGGEEMKGMLEVRVLQSQQELDHYQHQQGKS